MNRRPVEPHTFVSVSDTVNPTGRIQLCSVILLLLLLFPAFVRAQPVITRADSMVINNVSFEGNDAFSASELENVVLTTESPAGFWVFVYNNISEGLGSEQQFFDYPTFEEDALAIKLLYKNSGYFHTAVQKEIAFTNDSTEINATFRIEEGPAGFIDSINYRNIEALDSTIREQIFDDALIAVEQPYSAALLTAEESRILTLLRNNGYPRAYADSIDVVILLSTNNVTIKMPFYHGKRLYFGRITDSIVGVDRLNLARRVIYDRLEFEKGDVFSLAKLRNSESNLLRYNIFQSVEARAEVPPIENTSDSLVAVTMVLKPLNKWEIDITPLPLLQLKDNRLFAGPQAKVLWRNAFGGAQIMEVNTTYIGNVFDFAGDLPFWGAQEFRGQLRFDQPYFIDNYTSLGVSISYTYADEQNFFVGNFLHIVPNIRRIFSDNIVWNAELSLESLKFNIDPAAATGEDGTVEQRTPFYGFTVWNYINAIITTSVDLNFTNSIFNPSSGWAVRPTLEEAGFFGVFDEMVPDQITTTEYHKAELYFRAYTDLSRNQSTILAGKIRGGSIFPYDESALAEDPVPVPLTRRYYGGGANSVRGWAPRQLVADQDYVNVGSHVLFESSIEVRWQMFPTTTDWVIPIDALWLTVFTDAGNVWNKLDDVSIPSTALASGIGFAYLTGFGPIRVDFGYQMYNPALGGEAWFDTRPFAIKFGAFQFGVGWAF